MEKKNVNVMNLMEVTCVQTEDKYIWIVLNSLCDGMGLDYSSQLKRVKRDEILKLGLIKLKIDTNGGHQEVNCLDYNYIPLFLFGVKRNSISENSKYILTKAINFFMNTDLRNITIDTPKYITEYHLRDELFENGYFDNIKIIGKEIVYNFGRVDLLGEDSEGNKICIELKRYKEFNDTKEQLLRYKNSGEFKEIIYCAYEINEEFKSWCKDNDIKCYVYKRELKISEVF